MAKPETLLQHRLSDDWLIGIDRQAWAVRANQRLQELTVSVSSGTPPTLLLTQPDPEKFLADFLAACAAHHPIALGNPQWTPAEQQHVLTHLTLPTPAAAILIPTSGSSGQLRFAIHTWETLTASVYGFQQHFQVEQVNCCCVLPLHHVSGLMQAVRSLVTGGTLAIVPFKQLEAGELPPIDPADYFLSLVPTQLQRLLHHAETVDWLTRFRAVLLGGAPAWESLLQAAYEAQIPAALTYGMTETASQVATLKPEEFLQGNWSCGQVLPHAKLSICDDAGRLLGANQVGHLVIQADSLALGYLPGEPFAGRFCPDDLGYFDAAGYLHLVGRRSDKIISGGENIFPAEVESAIWATGLVQDVAVLGVSDRHWGEVVTAVYVPRQTTVLPTQLAQALQDKLSRYKHPKRWVMVDQLPRNAQGKINRAALRDLVD
ncbi:MAG TPA: 2-succinylbenzoate--CoA ligase [Synechococcales cyanobacterium M55_K2018_004]|nr:2-succinylbenzoate--CoA ligase [Synechococcales cyanobacterium M55_K2018_004]